MRQNVIRFRCTHFGLILLLFIVTPAILFSQSKIANIGSFESDMPAYWMIGNMPDGASLQWATDQAFVLGHSLKISKSATTDSASWMSENMCDNWTPKLAANSDITIGGFFKTENVNTNPATDDAKWVVTYSFYNQTGGLIGKSMLEIDQTQASSDWTEVSDNIVLPEDAYTVIVNFIGGPNATGTVWADAFEWPASWNRTLEFPTGWFNWLPWTDNNVSHGYENTRVTDEEAHSGNYSLKFDLPFDRQQQDAFVGSRRIWLDKTVKEGDVLRISVWIKAENLVPDSAAKYPDGWSVGFTPFFFKSADNNGGYDDISTWVTDSHFKFPPVTSFDWTEYYMDVEVPGDGTAALEVRVHPYSRFTGTIYFDDLSVTKLDVPKVADIGSFEGDLPAYWMKGSEPDGASVEWATDEAFVLGHSLKISKTSTVDSAAWMSENMCDNWTPKLTANSDIAIGGFFKTENVNTNPATDEAKWFVTYTFFNQSGSLIGKSMLDIDQTQASSDWTELTDNVVLPEDAYTVIVNFVGGKEATGTVWGDAFVWPASWNRTLEFPTGWFNWLPWTDNDVSHGYENTRLTTEEAHTGLHSLMFDLPFDRQQQDAFVGSRRVTLDESIMEGDMLRISVWIKAENLVPDSAARYPDAWSVGFTPFFFKSADNNAGYDDISTFVTDAHFKFPPATSFDWTEYTMDVEVPGDGTTALEVRLHPYSRFTGKIYFDDLTVRKLDVAEMAGIGGFEADMPSYWIKGSEPGGATLTWAQDQAFVLGHSLKINKTLTADSAAWVSANMCDMWTPKLSANSDIAIGGFFKTENVNTNPATDDAKWYVTYAFYNQAGSLIGKSMLELDQTQASSDWMEVTDNVVLPEDAYTTIINFVGGANATGTVWADAFVWPASWNRTLEFPTGWYNWLPWTDNNVSHGYENTRVTTADAHTGLHSLMFDLPFDRQQQDAFVGAKRVLLDGDGSQALSKLPNDITALTNVKTGDMLRISIWIKAEELVPDSAAKYPDSWAVGFTPMFFRGAGNNDGFDDIRTWTVDAHFKFPNKTSFDWTQFYMDVEVPGDGTKAMEVRLHPYSRFTGKIYMDDLEVKVIDNFVKIGDDANSGLPKTYALDNNYPNPFNPTTTIAYALPYTGEVQLEIFNVLGQYVRTLVNSVQQAGYHNVVWDAKDDFGNTVVSGMYFYRLKALNPGNINVILTNKMILLK
ncbi:T9SS type A sorting domain-containing protein [candidate division KSB1 bacterium]|nr:T9SS type A sorting domain-containing protein [candidate division KSB1 bacterium]